jgi:hypothetical protein
MELRRLFLKVMLWSLGMAALMGVLGMLMARTGMLWRITTTAAVTGAAAGLMIPMSMMVDRQQARHAGLLGMGLVVGQFLLAMTLTWENLLPGFVDDFDLILSMLLAAATGLPAMFFMWLAGTRLGAVAGRCGAWLCAFEFGVLMAALWWPAATQWYTQRHLWESSAAIAGLGPLAIACLVGISVTSGRWRRWLGVAASIAALAIALVAIWAEIQEGGGTFIAITCLAAVLAHANLVFLCPLTDGQRWLRWATIGAAALAGGIISVMALRVAGTGWESEFMARLAGASGIVAACGSLALLVLARLNRRVDYEPGAVEFVDITLLCPRCHKKQALPVGDARCSHCDLRIHTRIEDPRCPACGYSLYKLTSDRCPECGTMVRAEPTTA